MNPDLHKKIARLACWQSTVKVAPLSGGMTNQNFKVIDGDQQYVVRFGQDDPVHLISRANEQETCRAAYQAELAPELVHAEPGILVVRFIDGKVFQESDVGAEANLSRVVKIIRRFHQQVPRHYHQVPVMFWVFQVLRHYQNLLQEANSRHRKRLKLLDESAAMLEKAVGKVNIVFGHNDLLAANFIDDGKKIWLIDFDYAGFNSPLFDLSNLASNNDFSEEQEISMLETYFGTSINRQQWRSYYAMKCASLLRETLWSMVSEEYSELDVDYPEYTRKNLERYEQVFELYRHDYE